MESRPASDRVLEIDGVAKRFGATLALDGVHMDVRAAEVHALIGENGAGKSTLMNLISGVVHADRGAMRLDGRPYTPSSPHDARRRGIALIHQELLLCPHLTVAENVLLGMEASRRGWIDRAESRRRTAALLAQFGREEIDPDRRVGDLPLASRQVVEICRALAAEARILLMDEPTSAFQRQDTERLFTLIRRLTSSGIAVVYISHFLEEVREVAHRYTVLRDGRSVVTGSIADATNEQLIARMVGRGEGAPAPAPVPRRRTTRDHDIILRVQNLCAPPAVKDATFELHRGEILGIFGLIGAGRTELIRALFGLARVSTGRIELCGRPLALDASSADRVRHGFGYVSEDRKDEGLALPMSIADNLTATRLSAFANRLGWLHLGRQAAGAREWMDRLHVRTGARTPAAFKPAIPIRALSGGNQQKVAVGRLLHQDAAVFLLDEPTRGIDVGSREQVYRVIAAAAEEGKAILMVSSYLPELLAVCDRVAVMRKGRLLPALPVDRRKPEDVLAEAIGEAVAAD